MQLATSQRPHPPPVPPRPSRQVVAEALKRSPRPPCPTRQAPPPPNTKPWRSDQQRQLQQQQSQQQQVESTAGRTIIYESVKECAKDCKDESVSNDKNHRDNDQVQNTERNIEESQPESAGGVISHVQHHKTGITAEKLYSTGNVPVNIVRKRNSLTEDQRPQRKLEIRRNSRGKDHPAGGLSYRSERCRSAIGKDQRKENSVIASAEKFETKPLTVRAINVSFEDEQCVLSSSPDSSDSRVTVNHAEKCNGERVDGQKEAIAASGKLAGNDDVKTVSSNDKLTSAPSVDRTATTLLVVDETERKIALSDHEDSNDSDSNIHRQDWLEAGVRYSSTQITLHGDDCDDDIIGRDRINGYDHREEERITDLDFISVQERIAMSSLQGLPPLPRSLSGFNLSGGRNENCEPPPPPTRSSSKSQRASKTQSLSSRPSPPTRQLTTLDTQLAVLRREMFGLRQLDLSLLSQLWSLNESIQEFRQLLQEQEDRAPSPSPSSEEGDDTSYGVHPPPPPRRPAPTLHHHRPPRPPRPPRPSASDESPSSEEYGAV